MSERLEQVRHDWRMRGYRVRSLQDREELEGLHQRTHELGQGHSVAVITRGKEAILVRDPQLEQRTHELDLEGLEVRASLKPTDEPPSPGDKVEVRASSQGPPRLRAHLDRSREQRLELQRQLRQRKRELRRERGPSFDR